jgi:hypothetical protein
LGGLVLVARSGLSSKPGNVAKTEPQVDHLDGIGEPITSGIALQCSKNLEAVEPLLFAEQHADSDIPLFVLHDFDFDGSEFRGLSGTAVQRRVLEEVGCSHQSLAQFFGAKIIANFERPAADAPIGMRLFEMTTGIIDDIPGGETRQPL